MILVIGATGNVGSKLLRELAQRNAQFRALVHKEKDGERLWDKYVGGEVAT